MSKKLLALAAVGLVSYSLVGCSLFGGEDGSSSSAAGSSSSVGDTSKVVTSGELKLAGAAVNGIGSYLDIDGEAVLSGTDVLDATKAVKVDLQFAPTADAAMFNVPSVSGKAELKANGKQDLLVANIGKIDASKITKQYQIDSVLKAVASANLVTAVKAVDGEFLVMKTSEGVASLVEVKSATTTTAGIAMVKVSQK